MPSTSTLNRRKSTSPSGSETDRARSRAYVAELRRRYKAAGLCAQCGMVEVERYVRCMDCRKKHAVIKAASRARYIEEIRAKDRIRLRARYHKWKKAA